MTISNRWIHLTKVRYLLLILQINLSFIMSHASRPLTISPGRLIFIGHSHVRRLEEYLEKEETVTPGSLRFNLSNTWELKTSFFGFGGIKTRHILPASSSNPSGSSSHRGRNQGRQSGDRHASVAHVLSDAIVAFKPHVLALWIGDNDIQELDDSRDASEIAAKE